MFKFKNQKFAPRFSPWFPVKGGRHNLVSQELRAAVESYCRKHSAPVKSLTDFSYKDLWDVSGFNVPNEKSNTFVVEFDIVDSSFTVRRYLIGKGVQGELTIAACSYILPLRVDNLLVASSMISDSFCIAASSHGPQIVVNSSSNTPLSWIGPIVTEPMLGMISNRIFESEGNVDAIGFLKIKPTKELTALVAQPLVDKEGGKWSPFGESQEPICCVIMDSDVQDLFANNDMIVIKREKEGL